VWAEATAVSSYMRGVNSTYSLCAVRISSAFRTISDDAALVIAGQVPLCELVREAKEIRAALAGGPQYQDRGEEKGQDAEKATNGLAK